MQKPVTKVLPLLNNKARGIIRTDGISIFKECEPYIYRGRHGNGKTIYAKPYRTINQASGKPNPILFRTRGIPKKPEALVDEYINIIGLPDEEVICTPIYYVDWWRGGPQVYDYNMCYYWNPSWFNGTYYRVDDSTLIGPTVNIKVNRFADWIYRVTGNGNVEVNGINVHCTGHWDIELIVQPDMTKLDNRYNIFTIPQFGTDFGQLYPKLVRRRVGNVYFYDLIITNGMQYIGGTTFYRAFIDYPCDFKICSFMSIDGNITDHDTDVTQSYEYDYDQQKWIYDPKVYIERVPVKLSTSGDIYGQTIELKKQVYRYLDYTINISNSELVDDIDTINKYNSTPLTQIDPQTSNYITIPITDQVGDLTNTTVRYQEITTGEMPANSIWFPSPEHEIDYLYAHYNITKDYTVTYRFQKQWDHYKCESVQLKQVRYTEPKKLRIELVSSKRTYDWYYYLGNFDAIYDDENYRNIIYLDNCKVIDKVTGQPKLYYKNLLQQHAYYRSGGLLPKIIKVGIDGYEYTNIPVDYDIYTNPIFGININNEIVINKVPINPINSQNYFMSQGVFDYSRTDSHEYLMIWAINCDQYVKNRIEYDLELLRIHKEYEQQRVTASTYQMDNMYEEQNRYKPITYTLEETNYRIDMLERYLRQISQFYIDFPWQPAYYDIIAVRKIGEYNWDCQHPEVTLIPSARLISIKIQEIM